MEVYSTSIGDYSISQTVKVKAKRFNTFDKDGFLIFSYLYVPSFSKGTRKELVERWGDFPLYLDLAEWIGSIYEIVLESAYKEFYTKAKIFDNIIELAKDELKLLNTSGPNEYHFLYTIDPNNLNLIENITGLIICSTHCKSLDELMYEGPTPKKLGPDGKLIFSSKNVKYRKSFERLLNSIVNLAQVKFIQFLENPVFGLPEDIFEEGQKELLTAFHAEFNNELWEPIGTTEFLNTFRTNSKSQIKFKIGLKINFNYALSKIYCQRKISLVANFDKWYSQVFGGSFRNSKNPKKVSMKGRIDKIFK